MTEETLPRRRASSDDVRTKSIRGGIVKDEALGNGKYGVLSSAVVASAR